MGTGFIKCMPINFSGRLVALASRVIGIDEVLVAKIQSSFAIAEIFASTSALIFSFSTIASITRLQSPKLSRESANERLFVIQLFLVGC